MHIEKYKNEAVGLMVAHYDRHRQATLERDNIDETRTHLNYQIGNRQNEEIVSSIKKLKSIVGLQNNKAVRSDAVVMADIVLTKPSNVPESDLKLFFKESAKFLYKELSERGLEPSAVVKAYVHMDETTPHMHFAFTPVVKNKNGNLTFSYKQLVKRSFYNSVHTKLQNHLTEKLGYKPAVLLEGDDLLKKMSVENQKDFKQVVNHMEEVLDEKKAILSESNKKLKRSDRKLKMQKLNPLEPVRKINLNRQNKKLKPLKEQYRNLQEEYKNLEIQYSNLSQLQKRIAQGYPTQLPLLEETQSEVESLLQTLTSDVEQHD